MHKTLKTIILVMITGYLSAQCSPSGLPMQLPPAGTVTSEMTLSGSNNNQLGQNGQYLRAISLHILHDAIDELDIILIAPNGSSVQLTRYEGIQISQNITFDICFVACNQQAEPDPGFPAVFESDHGYEQDGHYSGSYYPSIGCLEELNGPVNGKWTLKIKDNFIQDGGRLINWALEFSDNSGLNCAASCLPPACMAPSSLIGSSIDSFCQGEPSLQLDLAPQYSFQSQDTSNFTYKFVIVNAATGVIVEITDVPDLRDYEAGNYKIYGISLLESQLSLLQNPNGTYNLRDLYMDITSEEYCARLSEDFRFVHIQGSPGPIQVSYPRNVCPGDTVRYIIENHDPELNYTLKITSGGYELIEEQADEFTLLWLEGPASLILTVFNDCDTIHQRLSSDIPSFPDFGCTPASSECPMDTTLYLLQELSDTTYDYQIQIKGGKMIRRSDDSLVVLWQKDTIFKQLCVYLQGTDCASLPQCISYETEDFDPQNILPEQDTLCPFDNSLAFLDTLSIPESFFWTGTGIEIKSDIHSDTLYYQVNEEADSARICIHIINECDTLGPFCRNIKISQAPELALDFERDCSSSYLLKSGTDADSIHWEQVSGPSIIGFNDPHDKNANIFINTAGDYQFRLNAFAGKCAASETLEVQHTLNPAIKDLTTICSLKHYRVSFDISEGKAPFFINGDTTYSRTYTSEYIPAGTAYHFEVVDSNGCVDQVNGLEHCPCSTEAGNAETESITHCASQGQIIRFPDFSGQMLDENDTLIYYLHTDADYPIQSKILSTGKSTLTFSDPLLYNKTYYLTAIVGDRINGALDLNDPCGQRSLPVPMTFYQPVTIDIANKVDQCIGSRATIELRASGPFPFEISLVSDQGRSQNLTVRQAVDHFEWNVQYQQESWEIDTVYTNCIPAIEGKIELQGALPKKLTSKTDTITLCLEENRLSYLDLNSLYLKNPAIPGQWASQELEIMEGRLQLGHGVDTGLYVLEFKTKDWNLPCPEIERSFYLQIEACECPQFFLPDSVGFCNSIRTVDLNDHLGLSVKGAWKVSNPYQFAQPPIVEYGVLKMKENTFGVFELQFHVHDLPESCPQVYRLTLSVENQLRAGDQNGIPSFCQGDAHSINLHDLLELEDEKGEWFGFNGSIDPELNIDSLVPGIQEFTYSHKAGRWCPGSSAKVRLEINKKPELILDKKDPQCYGMSTGQIIVNSSDPLAGPLQFYLDGKMQENPEFTELYAGSYEIWAQSFKGCTSDTYAVQLKEPDALEVELGHDLSAEHGEEVQIHAQTNIDPSEISLVEWFDREGKLPEHSMRLSYRAKKSETIHIRIENSDKCAALDSLHIKVNPKTDIYMPNTFNPKSRFYENSVFGVFPQSGVAHVESIALFDRWGNRLFQQNDFAPGDTRGFWDGTVNGNYMQEGVYVYHIQFISPQGETRTLQGDISILY